MKKNILFVAIFFCWTSLFAQIKGNVFDIRGNPVEGASVRILNTNKGDSTNSTGAFMIEVDSDGDYTIIVSFIGFKTVRKGIKVLNGKCSVLKFNLYEMDYELDNVTIISKSKSKLVKEKPFVVTSISTKGIKSTTTNANAILAKVSGVNVRRSGGLGSTYTFSMNGMSGKQIKFFIDDIPLDNLGSSLSLDNFPVNLIDRIDVFKGAVPVYLGSDALGGAVNIVTNQKKKNYLDVSHSFGSFNTHIFSLLGKYQDKKSGFVAKLSSFYNYSDNNYKIDNIDVTDKFGNIDGQINDVERKHDAYNSIMLNLQLGVLNKSFADELLIGGLLSKNRNELQHSYDYQKPFGEVEQKEKLNQVSFLYKKKNLLENLEAKIYASISKNVIKFRDTSSYIHYWTKKKKFKSSTGGELGSKTLLTLNDKMHLINTSLIYDFPKKKDRLVLNYTKSFLERVGTDKIVKSFSPFEQPHVVDKNILGFSYDIKLFDKKWNSSLFAKYYDLTIRGRLRNAFTDKIIDINNPFNKFGYGFATTYKIIENFQIKHSLEKAFRLPDGYEVFGDGALTESNVNLLPEKSLNFNFGGIFKVKITKTLELDFDINGFYRKAKNLIVVLPKITTRVFTNSYDARVTGVESSLNLRYNNKWVLKSNITNQNIEENKNGLKTKIPNIPLLFGNISLGYNIKNLFQGTDKLGFLMTTRYVEGFPVYSYISGDASKAVIDSQISQNFNVNYSIKNYHISLLIPNIWDAALYDNFRLQQPGRAFYLKLRYNI